MTMESDRVSQLRAEAVVRSLELDCSPSDPRVAVMLRVRRACNADRRVRTRSWPALPPVTVAQAIAAWSGAA